MNNNQNFEKFISNIKSINMSSDEKNTMRDQLMSFADGYQPVLSPYHHITLLAKRGLAVAFVAVLTIGSFTNYASRDLLPGEAFYSVKIAHEELKLATTLDTKKKISYEIKRTEKRIQEAVELATELKLDSEKQVSIAENIKIQTNKVQEHIEEIKINEPEEALILNAKLKSTIKINGDALRKLSTTTIKKEVVKEVQIVEPVEPKEIDTQTSKEQESQSSIEFIEIQEEVSENTLEILNASLTDSPISNQVSLLTEKKETDTQTSKEQESQSSIEFIEIQEEVSENTLEIITALSEEKLIEDQIVEYQNLEISFAENLLESIDGEVKDIEAFEDMVTQEIIQKENEALEAVEIEERVSPQLNQKTDSSQKDLPETKQEKEQGNLDSSKINKEIEGLQAVLEIQKEIEKFRIKYREREDTFNIKEQEPGENITELLRSGKHKQAFVVLQKILNFYKEKDIVEQVTLDLGIDFKETFDLKNTITGDLPSKDNPKESPEDTSENR